MFKPCKTEWQRKWLKLDCVHPEIQEIATKLEAYALRYFKNLRQKSKLVLIGDVGGGKTHCAKALAAWARHVSMAAFDTRAWDYVGHPPSVSFMRWPEIAEEISSGNNSAMEDMFLADLLILDDIGAENDPWKKVTDKLCQVLSRREIAWTIITTNVAEANWQTAWDARASDRLCGNAEIINLNCGSYRTR